MSRLSASKIDLARRCLWPFRPDAGKPNRSGFAASAGTIEHGHIEQTILGGTEEPRSETHERWLEDWWAHHKHDCIWNAEDKIALNPLTGETIKGPKGLDHRDYSWAPWGWLVGTIDAWGVQEVEGKRVLRIVDWKTGLAAHIKEAKDSGQMLFLGLAFYREVSKTERIDAVSLEYVLVNETRTWAPRCEVTRATLSMFQSELQELQEQLDQSPDPRPGFWCRSEWCGYHGRCPATSGALARVAGDIADSDFEVALSASDFVSLEHAAWQYRLLKAAEARLAEAWEGLKDRARQETIPLGDGRVYGPREKSRETVVIDDPKALVVLHKHLGSRIDSVIEVKKTTSKGKIDKELGVIAKERTAEAKDADPKAKRVTAKELKAPLYAELSDVGAIKITTYEELSEYQIKEASDEA